jgi:cytochrome c oxidase subunit II
MVLCIASVFMVLILSACGSNTKQTSQAATGKVVEIKVTAKDFEYNKKEIHVKKGDTVKITLQSDDGGHGLAIPKYNVNIQGNGSAEFTADKTGTFPYFCSIMCGAGHAKMTGKLVVE